MKMVRRQFVDRQFVDRRFIDCQFVDPSKNVGSSSTISSSTPTIDQPRQLIDLLPWSRLIYFRPIFEVKIGLGLRPDGASGPS
jgi:hypothetical protein